MFKKKLLMHFCSFDKILCQSLWDGIQNQLCPVHRINMVGWLSLQCPVSIPRSQKLALSCPLPVLIRGRQDTHCRFWLRVSQDTAESTNPPQSQSHWSLRGSQDTAESTPTHHRVRATGHSCGDKQELYVKISRRNWNSKTFLCELPGTPRPV